MWEIVHNVVFEKKQFFLVDIYKIFREKKIFVILILIYF